MNRYILMFEYKSKEFMDLERIITFKKNLEKVEKQKIKINMVFYGETTNEELATFMSYLNSLMQRDICKLSINLKTKEYIEEIGINNKSIKMSAKNAREIKNKKYASAIQDYYQDQELIIKVLPTKNWENLILDLIGE